ncbi:MAG: type II secretion system F family protein [Patescibacteria group bacterium]|nr:type II secretion system F family protein [Patescibacteria group bacterium]
MPFYYYEAKNLKGEKTSGTLETKDKQSLVWELKKDKFIPTLIEIRKEKKNQFKSFNFSIFKGVSLVDKLMFTRHLAVMVKGGVSLPEAIEMLANQVKSPYFQVVLKAVSKDVKKGVPLCEALENYPNIFSLIYVNMVRVGETLGKLEEALKLLALQIKKEHDLKSKVKGAMIYPGVVLAATFAIGIVMMIVVIPRITTIFSELEIELPLPTRMIIFASDFLQNQLFLFLGGVAVLGIGIRFFIKSSLGGKIISWFALKTPIIKIITIKINSASFCRTLSSMLDGGVPVVKALKIISLAVANVHYSQAIKEAAEEVKRGVSLNVVLGKKSAIFPPLVVQMVKVGEKTGMSVSILKQLADFYEQEVDALTKNMASIVEPVLMIIIGSAVGFFAISMLQPMYSIMEHIE